MSAPFEAIILRIITRPNVGGPTRHVALLQDGLARRGWSSLLVHGRCAPDEGEGLLSLGGSVRRLEGLGRSVNLIRDARTLRELRSLIRDARPRIVHTHQAKAGFLGRMAAAKEGVEAIVHTYHGHTFEGYFGALRGRAYLSAERRAAGRSHAIVVQSASQETEVARRLGRAAEGKFVRIAPAVDPRAIDATAEDGARLREEFGVDDRTLVLLLCARLVPIKRPERALRLLQALRRELPCELWIAGKGPLLPALRRQAAELDLGASLRFLEPRANPGALYRAADLALLTSRMEGTPLTLLEAAWLGTPVAAPRVGGIEDLFGDSGILFDPEAQEERWADALLARAPDAAARDALGRALAERVRARHSPERLVEEMDALYRRLLGDSAAITPR